MSKIRFIQNGESPEFGRFIINQILETSEERAKILIERGVAEKAEKAESKPKKIKKEIVKNG